MHGKELTDRLEISPVIAAIRDSKWQSALASPSEVLFYLEPHLSSIAQRVSQAHAAGKLIFVHLDMAEGIGKDKEGVEYLSQVGVDGIISTRSQIIRFAKDLNLITVQRFFLLDSQGLDSIQEMLRSSHPHYIELMPGVIPKVIRHFADGSIPVIAGGLIEEKAEITGALAAGALAVSTGREALWYL